MILAHSFTPGGPDIEFLSLAFAMLALAIVLFTQKSVKRSVPVVLVILAIGLVAGAFSFTSTVSSAGISVKILSPKDGATVPANKPVKLDVMLTGGVLVPGTSTDPKAGHFHIFVDQRLISMQSSSTPQVKLSPGRHTVDVEFTNAKHISFSPRVVAGVTLVAK